MDNEFTRKELPCPLSGKECDSNDKDCNKCIAEEIEWEKSQNS